MRNLNARNNDSVGTLLPGSVQSLTTTSSPDLGMHGARGTTGNKLSQVATG